MKWIVMAGLLLQLHCGAPAPPAPAGEPTLAADLVWRHATAGDLDGDGVTDCWQRGSHGPPSDRLQIWLGCTGEPYRFEVAAEGLSLLVVPDRLASPRSLAWIARELAGDAVETDAAPSAAWSWVLASAARVDVRGSAFAIAPPVWRHGEAWRASAMIVPRAPVGWFTPDATSWEVAPVPAPAGARILVDRGFSALAAPVACAGLRIAATPGGLVAERPDGTRSWLFRGLPEHGGFAARRILCEADLVVATDRRGDEALASVVVVDPASGGWLHHRATDCCAGAELRHMRDGPLFTRELSTSYPLSMLQGWLRSPLGERPSDHELSLLARPELADPAASELQLSLHGQRMQAESEAGTEMRPASALPPAVRAGLVPAGECAGFSILASTTAVLVERAGQARWLYVRDARPMRIDRVRCEAGWLVVDEAEPGDALRATVAATEHRTLRFDVARGRVRYPPAP